MEQPHIPTVLLVKALDAARDGVPYDAKDGAKCPFCGRRAEVTHTKEWLDRSRMRYHKCVTATCPLYLTSVTIRSWQEA